MDWRSASSQIRFFTVLHLPGWTRFQKKTGSLCSCMPPLQVDEWLLREVSFVAHFSVWLSKVMVNHRDVDQRCSLQVVLLCPLYLIFICDSFFNGITFVAV